MSATRTVIVGLAAALLGGCTTDQYARALIQPDTNWGIINEAVMGPSEQLVKDKLNRITAAPSFDMPDGTKIDVWVLAAATDADAPARGTVLIVHDLADSKVAHLRLGQVLSQRGFHAVLPDLRRHGRSTGQYVTYGALERRDLKRVMDALYENGTVAGPLYVFGPTMGGAIAILYAAIDSRVQGVLAISPNKDFPAAAERFFKSKAILLNPPQLEEVIARAGEIGDFQPGEASTVAAAAQVKVPMLLLHGGTDVIVPKSESEAIRDAAAGPKQLEIMPLVGHIGAMFGREAAMADAIERVVSGKLAPAAE